MRITKDLLMKYAHNAVDTRVRQDHHILCVYLTGSLLDEEPLIGGTTDIDLFFIHNDEPDTQHEIVPINEDVHLDITHLSRQTFIHPRTLRADPWLGSFLCHNPLQLHDTLHWFEFTQASVCAQFDQPEVTLQRAHIFSDDARQTWAALRRGDFAGAPAALLAYLQALEKASNAIACLTGVPLTERRFMLQFPQRAEAIGRPGLAAGLVDLFLSEEVSAEDWEKWLEAWKASLAAAGQTKDFPTRLHPARQAYYHRSVTVLADDQPAAAVWVLLRTWTLAQTCLSGPTHLQPWQTACQTLELGEEHLSKRLDALDAFLDTIEESLDLWGKEAGV